MENNKPKDLFQIKCENYYTKCYEINYIRFLNGRDSKAAQTNAERDAQRVTIKETLKYGLENFPEIESAAIWNFIYSLHLKRKANLTSLAELDEEIIAKVISADQSWKKASGHAFEEFIYETLNPQLKDAEIKFLLQRDIHTMLNNGQINNDQADIEWLKQKLHRDVFDLYAVLTYLGNHYVYGCIQSKTSVRDRVSRDREPSIEAMEQKFWSIAIVLNGKFLALPKFKEMVNGGGSDYDKNGWHGLYVMSNKNIGNRIYPTGKNFSLLVSHAKEAAQSWTRARHRFTNTWAPTKNNNKNNMRYVFPKEEQLKAAEDDLTKKE